MKRQWLALLLTALLAMAPAALAEEEAESGFGTFLQPEGVELCAVEEAAGLAAPDGLEDMYTLMQRCNPFASAYVFRMPEGRALMSVACTTTGSPKTALELLESGVMKADDFAALAEHYSENPTMLRLVALHARKGMYAAAGEPMRAERDALAGVVETCNRRLTAELDSFDRLTAKLSAEGSPEC